MKAVFSVSLLLGLSFPLASVFAQVSINESGNPPHPSAALDVDISGKGLLPPRLTAAQRDAIVNPPAGLHIYNTETNCDNFFNGSNWMELCGSCVPQPSQPNAGPDLTDLPGTSVNMAGNTPGPGNTGLWFVVSGSGGSFAEPSNPQSVFNGLPGVMYVLRWSHSNTCGSSSDDVQIVFLPEVFACSSSIVVDVDNNVYNTVQIGEQCWLKENLRTTKYRNAVDIDYPGTSNQVWTDNTNGAYAWYNNDPSNGTSYGALYNWYATQNANGLCPEGWHVPSVSEWTALIVHLGGASIAGGPMKLTTLWSAPNTAATNASGFSAQPAGYRQNTGGFALQNLFGYMWSSTPINTLAAWGRGLSYTSAAVTDYNNYKNDGFAVRCIRD